jgi:hypothetical protein
MMTLISLPIIVSLETPLAQHSASSRLQSGVSFGPFELPNQKPSAVGYGVSIRQPLKVQPMGPVRVSTLAQKNETCVGKLIFIGIII